MLGRNITLIKWNSCIFSTLFPNGETYYYLCAKYDNMLDIIKEINNRTIKDDLRVTLDTLRRERRRDLLIQIRLDTLDHNMICSTSIKTLTQIKEFINNHNMFQEPEYLNNVTWSDFKNYINK